MKQEVLKNQRQGLTAFLLFQLLSSLGSLSCGSKGLNPLKQSLFGIFPFWLKQEIPGRPQKLIPWRFLAQVTYPMDCNVLDNIQKKKIIKIWGFTQINPVQNSLLLIFRFWLKTVYCKSCIFPPLFVPVFPVKISLPWLGSSCYWMIWKWLLLYSCDMSHSSAQAADGVISNPSWVFFSSMVPPATTLPTPWFPDSWRAGLSESLRVRKKKKKRLSPLP